MVRPGTTVPNPAGFSTRKVVRFWWGLSAPRSVRTSVATSVEEPPLVSHTFAPSTTEEPPSGPAGSGTEGGGAAVGQPRLRAVDDVGVPVGHGRGADAGDVGAQARLGHGERATHLTGGHPREEVLLLRLRAVLADHVGDDEVGVDDTRDAHPAAGDLLDHQRVGQQRLPETAVLLGDHQPADAELLEPLDDLGRVLVGVLEALRVGDDLLVHEAADC